MRALPVIPRALARADVDDAVAYLMAEAGDDTAFAFVTEIENAFGMLGEFPAAGTPRWAHELNLAGLRSWRLNKFPWLIFYVVQNQCIDVWRVLHVKRDIPDWLSDAE